MTLKSFTAAILLAAALGVAAQTPASTAPGSKAGTNPAAASKTVAQKPPQPGMVWANTKTKVYHKEGDQWFGKGTNGQWMSEADAKKNGYKLSKTGAAKPSTSK